MTPKQLKSARKKLGLSARGLAIKVGLNERWGDRTVRRWEAGNHSIPEHVEKTVKELLGD